ncbi:MAG: hypothetical protein LBU43_11615 [Candidatus Accumulibacter sp.]|jgi:hypothetical protein|nr:hypothetical protein [Accumulibacter sp.]
MKKHLIAAVAFFLLGLVMVGDASADRGGYGHHGGHGWSHGHSRVGVGVVIGSPFWYPWYSTPYYPPVVIERQAPPVYIEQAPVVERAPQTGYSGYWYYCQSPSGYYPEIRECPGNWVKVPPRP